MTPQSKHGRPHEDKKGPKIVPVPSVSIKHQCQKSVPKLQSGSNGKKVKQNVSAAKQIDPPPPIVIASILKKGDDSENTQSTEKAHQEIIEQIK